VGDESDVGDKPNQVHCNMEVSQWYPLYTLPGAGGWLRPVILATQEVEIRKTEVWSCPGK
jgi:hypothetical protein